MTPTLAQIKARLAVPFTHSRSQYETCLQDIAILLQEVERLEGRLQGQAYVCSVCWTNSYEPCGKGTPDAVQQPDTDEHETSWWRCLCCWQIRLLTEQNDKLTQAEARCRSIGERLAFWRRDIAYKAPEQLTPHYFGVLLDDIKAKQEGAR
mgnify:CR=1 FL=1